MPVKPTLWEAKQQGAQWSLTNAFSSINNFKVCISIGCCIAAGLDDT